MLRLMKPAAPVTKTNTVIGEGLLIDLYSMRNFCNVLELVLQLSCLDSWLYTLLTKATSTFWTRLWHANTKQELEQAYLGTIWVNNLRYLVNTNQGEDLT